MGCAESKVNPGYQSYDLTPFGPAAAGTTTTTILTLSPGAAQAPVAQSSFLQGPVGYSENDRVIKTKLQQTFERLTSFVVEKKNQLLAKKQFPFLSF